MLLDILNPSSPAMQKQFISQIEKCNHITAPYGLTLSHKDAIELAETRSEALKNTRRVEFGNSVVNKIIIALCDSPYVSMRNYTDTLTEMIDMFYFYKNETLDIITDDDLIEFMICSFNGVCEGSLDLLRDRELANFANQIANGETDTESEREATFRKYEEDKEDYD